MLSQGTYVTLRHHFFQINSALSEIRIKINEVLPDFNLQQIARTYFLDHFIFIERVYEDLNADDYGTLKNLRELLTQLRRDVNRIVFIVHSMRRFIIHNTYEKFLETMNNAYPDMALPGPSDFEVLSEYIEERINTIENEKDEWITTLIPYGITQPKTLGSISV